MVCLYSILWLAAYFGHDILHCLWLKTLTQIYVFLNFYDLFFLLTNLKQGDFLYKKYACGERIRRVHLLYGRNKSIIFWTYRLTEFYAFGPSARLLTIRNFYPHLCLRFILPSGQNALAGQNAAYWPAKPMVLARNMLGFAAQNAGFQIVICMLLQSNGKMVAFSSPSLFPRKTSHILFSFINFVRKQ